MSVFISYSWKDKKPVDEIANTLSFSGVKFILDSRDFKYLQSIREFMKQISKSDYVILVISREYLQSVNCMYEVLELLKSENFKTRIFPIIIENANIFDAGGKLYYLKYWEGKIKQLNHDIKELDNIANTKSVQENIDIYTEIRNSIDEFCSIIADKKCPTVNELKDLKYSPFFEFIKFKDTDIIKEVVEVWQIEDIEEQDICLDKLSRKYPLNEHFLFISGFINMQKGNFKKSKYFFEELLEKYPDHFEGHNNLGVLLVSQFNDIESAKMHYLKANSINPENVGALINLSNVYYHFDKNINEAIKSLQKALKIEPLNSEVNLNMAVILEIEITEYASAKTFYENSLINAKDAEPYIKFSNFLFMRLSDIVSAIKYSNMALEMEPNNPTCYLNHANILSENKPNISSAIKFYKKAIELKPDYAEAHYNLAAAYISSEIKLIYDAKKHYNIAINLNPKFEHKEYNDYFNKMLPHI